MSDLPLHITAPENTFLVRGKGPGKQFARYLLNQELFVSLGERVIHSVGRDEVNDFLALMHYIKTGEKITPTQVRKRLNAEWDAELSSS